MSRFFDYFQIAGLVFYFSIVTGRILYLRFSENINAFSLIAGKKGLQRVTEVSFLAGLTTWIFEVLSYSLHLEFKLFPRPLDMPLLDSMTAKLIGVALVVSGFILFSWALVSFGNSWRIGIDNKTPGKLVTTGIFTRSRNPIYLFLDLYSFGTFLINGTLIFLILSLLVIVGLHYQILQEEKALVRIYGEAYQSYCARTNRYFARRHSERL